MIVIDAQNVNHAFAYAVEMFQNLEKQPSAIVAPRGKRTVEVAHPVTTVYHAPEQRVLFNAARDANPFFHLFEALWMLDGRNDAEFPVRLVKRMAQFSDDGVTLWGAYGYRWRKFFGFDQLAAIVELLKKDPDSRRAVLQMWAPDGDLQMSTPRADIPCNTAVYFKVRQGALNMTVTNRSNDMIWGAYGANVVQMSILQEYLAAKLGVQVGRYHQVSDSFHVYLDDEAGDLWNRIKAEDWRDLHHDPYRAGTVAPYPLGAQDREWDNDLHRFLNRATWKMKMERQAFVTDFFRDVAVPMWRAWEMRNPTELDECIASDWKLAGQQWLERRAQP